MPAAEWTGPKIGGSGLAGSRRPLSSDKFRIRRARTLCKPRRKNQIETDLVPVSERRLDESLLKRPSTETLFRFNRYNSLFGLLTEIHI